MTSCTKVRIFCRLLPPALCSSHFAFAFQCLFCSKNQFEWMIFQFSSRCLKSYLYIQYNCFAVKTPISSETIRSGTLIWILKVFWDPPVYMDSMCSFNFTLTGIYSYSAYVHILGAIMDVSCNLCLQKICAGPEGLRCNVLGMTGHICRYCCLFFCWLQVEQSVLQSASSGR